MITRNTKNQLLAGTSALALIAAASVVPSQAFAAWSTLGSSTAGPVTAAATAANLQLNTGIDITGAADGADNALGTGSVIINSGTGHGIEVTGVGNSAINISGAGVSSVTLTTGQITSAGTTTHATIIMDGGAGSPTISTATGTNITNTGTAAAISIGPSSANLITATVTNAGTIASGGDAIDVGVGSGAIANTLTLGNTGTITAGAGSYAIDIVNGAGVSAITNSTGGIITGAVYLGNNATTALNLKVGSTLTGNIGGAGAVELKAPDTGVATTYTAAGDIGYAVGGGAAAITTLKIDDGLSFTTTGKVDTTGGILLGNSTAGSTLNITSGVITGGVQGSAGHAGTGILNVNGAEVLAGTAGIGSTTALATINIADGDSLDATASTAGIKATQIYVGSSTAGATFKVGAEALTGLVDSKSNGTSTLTFTGNSTLGAGTAIGSAHSFATININDGVTVDDSTANGVIKATNVVLGSTTAVGSTLTLGTGVVTGTISTLVTNQGVLNIGGTQSLGGNVGASGKVLNAVNVTAGTTSVGANTIYATSLAVASGATLALNTGVVNGAIWGTGGAGTVTFAGTQTTAGSVGVAGHVLLEDDVNAGSNITLGATTAAIDAATTKVTGTGVLNFGTVAHTVIGDITGFTTGTLNLGTATTTETGNFTTAATNTVDVTINNATTSGKLTASSNATVAAGTNLAVNMASTSHYIAAGDTYIWLTGTGANTNATTVTDNSAVVNFTDNIATGGERILVASRVAGGYAGVATTTDTSAAGATLEALGVAGTTNAQIVPFLAFLDQAPNAATLTADLKQVTPQVNATSVQAISDTTQALNVVSTRLTDLRAGIDTSSNGMAAGGRVADKGIWFEGFGSTATQDLRSGVDGYDVTTGGGAVGADMAVADNARLGLSASYARSNVDSNGSAIQSTDIDSYQVNAYGSYNMGKWYTDGLLGVAYQDFTSDRTITGAGIANGSFSGETYTARATEGYRFQASNGIDITPNAGLTYYYNHVGGYTETGAGGMDDNVGSSDTQALIGRIGADVGHDFHSGTTLIRPVLRAGYSYDFIGDQVSTTSNFTGGGGTFTTKDASPERNAFDVGASLNIARTDNLTFSADYDYMGKSGYSSNSGIIRARYNF